jgi:outer membrane protein
VAIVPAAAQQPRAVTLAEAIRLAAGTDPAVIQAVGDLRSAGATVLAAKGSFLPSVSAIGDGGSSYSEGPARTDPITGELLTGDTKSQSATFGLSGSLDLFAGFRRTADLRAAQRQEDRAEAARQEALAQSVLRTSGEFFNALASRELVEVRRATVRRAEEQLTIAVAKLQTRSATVADSLRALVSLGEARLALVSEAARLATSEANLGRRLGVGGRVAALDDSTLQAPGVPVDTTALLAEALSRAPAVRRARASREAAEASLAAAKSAYWPTLSLSGGYNYSGSDRDDFTLYNSRRIGLSLNWPLFNRFQREQQVSSRAAARDVEVARSADAEREVVASLAGHFASLAAAEERIALTRLSVTAARADVLVALERYRLGSITITDLGQSQEGLRRAEENAVSARFEYLRARAEIEAILGRRL